MWWQPSDTTLPNHKQMDLLRKVINMNLLSFIHILFRPKQGFGYLEFLDPWHHL